MTAPDLDTLRGLLLACRRGEGAAAEAAFVDAGAERIGGLEEGQPCFNGPFPSATDGRARFVALSRTDWLYRKGTYEDAQYVATLFRDAVPFPIRAVTFAETGEVLLADRGSVREGGGSATLRESLQSPIRDEAYAPPVRGPKTRVHLLPGGVPRQRSYAVLGGGFIRAAWLDRRYWTRRTTVAKLVQAEPVEEVWVDREPELTMHCGYRPGDWRWSRTAKGPPSRHDRASLPPGVYNTLPGWIYPSPHEAKRALFRGIVRWGRTAALP